MAHIIDRGNCISCGLCAAECPEEAVSDDTGAFTIDAEKCTDCGTCAELCPTSAIELTDDDGGSPEDRGAYDGWV